EDFSKAVKLINESNPDIIVFLGDLFDEFSTYEGDDQKISAALAELKAKKGKFAVFGNHDYGGGAENEYVGVMDAGGFRVLVNQSVQFKESNVTLTGVDDYLIGYGNASVVNENPLGAYNIVACHEPDVIDKIMNSPVDLMISGHTHGGQVKLPFVEPRYLPDLGKKYIQGKFEINNLAKTTLYVNRGLGTTKAPARLFSVPEVTIIDLK
ncbi:MAG: metallophosphoesterase, partial [Anaerovoracaceae bacterium]